MTLKHGFLRTLWPRRIRYSCLIPLEGRFPFLSPKIIEFVSGLPDDYKLDSNDGKIVLRRAFERDLPKEVLTRPKMGFSVPVGDLVLEMRDRLYDLLDSGRNGVFSNLLDCNAIREDFDDHFSGRNEQPLWLWTLFVILQWQDIAFAN